MIIDSNGEFRANFVVSMVVMIYSESCCFHDRNGGFMVSLSVSVIMTMASLLCLDAFV